MAKIRIGRIWHEELIPLTYQRVKLEKAEDIMEKLRSSPLRKPDGEHDEGDFWIEVTDKNDDIIIDPVRFGSNVFEQVALLVMSSYSWQRTSFLYTDAGTQSQYDAMYRAFPAP